MQVLSPERTGIWSVGYCGGRKTREPGEKLLRQDENQLQTQPRPHWWEENALSKVVGCQK